MTKNTQTIIVDTRPTPRQTWLTKLLTDAGEKLTGQRLPFHHYGDLQEGYKDFLQAVASQNLRTNNPQEVGVYAKVLDKVAAEVSYQSGLRKFNDTEEEKIIGRLVVMRNGLVNKVRMKK